MFIQACIIGGMPRARAETHAQINKTPCSGPCSPVCFVKSTKLYLEARALGPYKHRSLARGF